MLGMNKTQQADSEMMKVLIEQLVKVARRPGCTGNSSGT
jgi:hypothetical protein